MEAAIDRLDEGVECCRRMRVEHELSEYVCGVDSIDNERREKAREWEGGVASSGLETYRWAYRGAREGGA